MDLLPALVPEEDILKDALPAEASVSYRDDLFEVRCYGALIVFTHDGGVFHLRTIEGDAPGARDLYRVLKEPVDLGSLRDCLDTTLPSRINDLRAVFPDTVALSSMEYRVKHAGTTVHIMGRKGKPYSVTEASGDDTRAAYIKAHFDHVYFDDLGELRRALVDPLPGARLQALPTEIVMAVLSYLPERDRFSAEVASKPILRVSRADLPLHVREMADDTPTDIIGNLLDLATKRGDVVRAVRHAYSKLEGLPRHNFVLECILYTLRFRPIEERVLLELFPLVADMPSSHVYALTCQLVGQRTACDFLRSRPDLWAPIATLVALVREAVHGEVQRELLNEMAAEARTLKMPVIEVTGPPMFILAFDPRMAQYALTVLTKMVDVQTLLYGCLCHGYLPALNRRLQLLVRGMLTRDNISNASDITIDWLQDGRDPLELGSMLDTVCVDAGVMWDKADFLLERLVNFHNSDAALYYAEGYGPHVARTWPRRHDQETLLGVLKARGRIAAHNFCEARFEQARQRQKFWVKHEIAMKYGEYGSPEWRKTET